MRRGPAREFSSGPASCPAHSQTRIFRIHQWGGTHRDHARASIAAAGYGAIGSVIGHEISHARTGGARRIASGSRNGRTASSRNMTRSRRCRRLRQRRADARLECRRRCRLVTAAHASMSIRMRPKNDVPTAPCAIRARLRRSLASGRPIPWTCLKRSGYRCGRRIARWSAPERPHSAGKGSSEGRGDSVFLGDIKELWVP